MYGKFGSDPVSPSQKERQEKNENSEEILVTVVLAEKVTKLYGIQYRYMTEAEVKNLF